MAAGRKTGGRRKGTPNRVTGQMRERVQAIIDELEGDVTEALRGLDDKDKVSFYLALLEYSLPKLSRVELSGEDGKELKITVKHVRNTD